MSREISLLALFWDLCTNFHAKFMLTCAPFPPFASPPENISYYHNALTLFCCVPILFLCMLCNLLNWNTVVVLSSLLKRQLITQTPPQLMITHSSRLLSVAVDAAGRMHLISTHCAGAWEPWFITARKTYDPINTSSTFGNDKSVQQGKHCSSQTWCDEIFQLAVGERHNKAQPVCNHKLHFQKGELI